MVTSNWCFMGDEVQKCIRKSFSSDYPLDLVPDSVVCHDHNGQKRTINRAVENIKLTILYASACISFSVLSDCQCLCACNECRALRVLPSARLQLSRRYVCAAFVARLSQSKLWKAHLSCQTMTEARGKEHILPQATGQANATESACGTLRNCIDDE